MSRILSSESPLAMANDLIQGLRDQKIMDVRTTAHIHDIAPRYSLYYPCFQYTEGMTVQCSALVAMPTKRLWGN
jgi:hypothetical protein